MFKLTVGHNLHQVNFYDWMKLYSEFNALALDIMTDEHLDATGKRFVISYLEMESEEAAVMFKLTYPHLFRYNK